MKKAIPIIISVLIVPVLVFDIFALSNRIIARNQYQDILVSEKNLSRQDWSSDVNVYLDRFQSTLDQIQSGQFDGDDMGLKNRIFVTNTDAPADISKFNITTEMQGINPSYDRRFTSLIVNVRRQYQDTDLRSYQLIVKFDQDKKIKEIKYYDEIA